MFPNRKNLSLGVRRLLGWLDRFDGMSWEERWLASGADRAPRSWREAVEASTPVSSLKPAVNALMVARVLRPSYGWQLAAGASGKRHDPLERPNYERRQQHRTPPETTSANDLLLTGSVKEAVPLQLEC
ncbi:hypothetical protein [Kribbella sp. DT2]|uniref:hypothetical protein n=1 Tax=Kribbella sp. DT2 TaxID=3393427 RepID=UPI003CF3C20A